HVSRRGVGAGPGAPDLRRSRRSPPGGDRETRAQKIRGRVIIPDGAGAVRAGEELDADRLALWLRDRLPGIGGAVGVSQFRHGHSNLTYLVTLEAAEYVLRRPPFGNQVKTAHDMSREFRMLEALAPIFPEAPRPLLFCDDSSILGAPFYLMERRR